MLSIRVHSPTKGVIGVNIDHYKHTPSLNTRSFPTPSPPPTCPSRRSNKVAITENPDTLTFTGPDGRELTAVRYKHQAAVDIPQNWLGKNGQSVSIWNADGGTMSEQVPFPSFLLLFL